MTLRHCERSEAIQGFASPFMSGEGVRGRRGRVVLASSVFPELFQRQIIARICRAGLGLSSAVFRRVYLGNSRRSDPTRETTASPL